MQTAKYPYGDDFQFKILALLVQDPTFLASHYDSLNPNFFERVHVTTVCQLLLTYYGYYRVVPDYSSLMAMVEDHVAKASAPKEVADSIRQTVWWIYSNAIADSEYVKTQVLRFGQRQALKGAVSTIIDKLEKDSDYDDCRTLVEQALQVGMRKDGGLDFGASQINLPALAAKSQTYSRRVPTLLPHLDGCLMGGLGIGELGVIVAPSGTGKTTTLVNFGWGAITFGYNVLHITLELKEIDIAMKYGARFSGRTIDSIVQGDMAYHQAVQMNPIPENRLKIKYFSPGTATTSNIRALMSFLRGQGFCPDLLIVDYIKKMKFDGEIVGGLGRISDELITIGDDYKCGVWTAQQAQRNYRFAERTSVTGIANDVSIIENCDVALALSQNEQEHQLDRVRIETGKVRRGDDTHTIYCNLNYSTSSLWEMTEGEVAAYYNIDTSAGKGPNP